jgi:radical SAM protein with 4Fe4S-binding SPASM domain
MATYQSPYKPSRCVYEATLACNLRCRHCGSRAGRAREGELTTGEAADLFTQLAELGCERVTISGGEALLREDWPELIAAAHGTGMKVGLITNGIALTPDTAKRARDQGLGAVGLSVDGIGPTHDRIRGRIGHFRAVTRAIDAAVGADLKFSLVTHLNRWNIGELADLHEFATDSGAYAWQVQTATDMGNLLDHPELKLRSSDLVRIEAAIGALVRRGGVKIAACNSMGYFGPHESLLRKGLGGKSFAGCPAGIRTVGIESNGNVKGCLAIMPGGDGCGSPYVEGNVRDERLAEIWHRPGAFAYNRLWSADDVEGFCRTCSNLKKCRGGCRANMVASGDGIDNPMCVHRALEQEDTGSSRASRAAAILLAATLGASFNSCGRESSRDGDDDNDDASTDTETDTSTDTGTDSDVDSDTDTDTDSDTDSDTDTDVDTDTDAYDIPPW